MFTTCAQNSYAKIQTYGVAMKLNNIKIKNAKPKDKMYRISDGDNLYLEINTNGNKYWRMTYRYNNKRRQTALGKYPVISLQEARDMRLATQRLLIKGIDPVDNKRQKKLEQAMQHDNNFEAIAREWHENKLHTWQPKHAETILRRLSMYIFPVIGKKSIADIKPPELLHALRPIEDAGKHEMAHRMLQTSGQIFRFAVTCGKADRDITQDLRGALKPSKSQNYPYLRDHELHDFLQKLNNYDLAKDKGGCSGRSLTKWSFELLILTFVRTGEIRGMRWDEIDFDTALWKIPAERMKMKSEHVVPLSKQAIALLRKIEKITGDSYSGNVFPSFQNPRKTISENTFLRAIFFMGYKGRTVGHGFRATASTILNENGFRPDIIERQLAHCERDQVRAAYNHAQYLPERVEMMQWWSDCLIDKGMEI